MNTTFAVTVVVHIQAPNADSAASHLNWLLTQGGPDYIDRNTEETGVLNWHPQPPLEVHPDLAYGRKTA